MKKSLLLICLLFSIVLSGNAQQQYEISFTNATVTNPQNFYPNHDTAYFGQKLRVHVAVHNDGTLSGTGNQTFPGGTVNIRYYVGNDFANRKVNISSSVSLPPIGINVVSAFEDDLLIDKAVFKPDTLNIVIIWPTGGIIKGLSDSLDSSKYTILQFYVSSGHNTGIKNSKNIGNFNIYPNPAKDNINVKLASAAKGTIQLTDMSGKIVLCQPFDVHAEENIRIPVNEGDGLANGIYFVAVQTSEFREVSKIIINR